MIGAHEANPPPPAGGGDPRADMDRNSGRAGLLRQCRIDRVAPVEDRGDVAPAPANAKAVDHALSCDVQTTMR